MYVGVQLNQNYEPKEAKKHVWNALPCSDTWVIKCVFQL